MIFATRLGIATYALIAVGFVVLPLQGWGDGIIPGPGDGYNITTTIDTTQEAPEGYEGNTHIKEQVAVGNTPATAGKRVVTNFTMMNQVKTCPNADGTAEGKGEISMTVTGTNAQSTGTGNFNLQIHALAKYKGQVSEDAYLHDPVNADIDYTYNQSGSFPSGTITTTPGSNSTQHITIQFMVAAISPKSSGSTTFGDIGGGDPTQGHYSSALALGMGLVQFAGFYYSVAETKWLQGKCVKVAFDPPSFTMLPVLGGQTVVNATLKTNGGESVKATYQNVRAYGGSIDPMGGGSSDVGAPLKFTYTAPDKKVELPVPGFAVDAVSHAGIAVDQLWQTHLGTDWTGQITCSRIVSGDAGSNDLQTWSDSQATRMTVVLGNDNSHRYVTTYGEQKDLAINKQKALRGGSITLIDNTSATEEASLSDVSPAMLQVDIDKAQGTYSIQTGATTPMKPSKMHSVTCVRDKCTNEDLPYYVQGCFTNGMSGKLVDLNHLSGSQTEVKTGLGRGRNGTLTHTVTWNLARTGTNH